MANKGHGGNPNAAANLTDDDRAKGEGMAHERGNAHEFSSEEASKAGRKGGESSHRDNE